MNPLRGLLMCRLVSYRKPKCNKTMEKFQEGTGARRLRLRIAHQPIRAPRNQLGGYRCYPEPITYTRNRFRLPIASLSVNKYIGPAKRCVRSTGRRKLREEVRAFQITWAESWLRLLTVPLAQRVKKKGNGMCPQKADVQQVAVLTALSEWCSG